MLKNYSTTNFTDFEGWRTRVKLICESRTLELDFDMVENSFDLEKIYEKGLTPRQAAESIGKEIFDL